MDVGITTINFSGSSKSRLAGRAVRLLLRLLVGPQWEVHRFPGCGWSNFFAWETTICVHS